MCLQTGRIDPDRLVRGVFGSQPDHDAGEDAVVAPGLPAVIEGLGRTIQNAPVVDAGLVTFPPGTSLSLM